MNLLKRIVALFSFKQAVAQKIETYVTDVPDQYGSYRRIGSTDYPVFMPQQLLSFYCLHKAMTTQKYAVGNVSDVKAMDFFTYDGLFCFTAFTVEEVNGYYWAKVGSSEVNFSGIEAFKRKTAKSISVPLKRKNETTIYIADCKYRNGYVIVTGILESTMPDNKVAVSCNILPCTLDEALEFINKL